MYYCEEPSIRRPPGPQTYQYNQAFKYRKKYKTHLKDICVVVVSCRIDASTATTSTILCFLSFVLPHAHVVLVPSDDELPQALGTLVSDAQVVEKRGGGICSY